MMETVLVKQAFVKVTMDPNREKIDNPGKNGVRKQEYDQEFFDLAMYQNKLIPQAIE